MTQRPLDGKTILVTGASSGLGAQVAFACAQAGASVVLIGRRVSALEAVYDRIEDSGAPQPAIYPLDLEGAAPADYEQLATTVTEQCGSLDGLVHCAATLGQLAPSELVEPAAWARVMATNLNGPVLLTQACLPLLRQYRGSLVFTLDDKRRAYWGAYGVSKAGLAAYMEIVSRETLGDGDTPVVRVYGVAPGPMRTALRGAAYPAEDRDQNPLPEEYAPLYVDLLCGANAAQSGTTIQIG